MWLFFVSVVGGNVHAEAALTGSPYEDTAKKVLSRRASLRYPGSITGHPVRITDTKEQTQRSQQNYYVNYHQSTNSRLTSHPGTYSDLASSADEGETCAVLASEPFQSDAEIEPRNEISSLSLSTQPVKPVVRRRKDAVLSYGNTLTDPEDGQDETDTSERSSDTQHKRKVRSPVTVNLSGTRYDVGENTTLSNCNVTVYWELVMTSVRILHCQTVMSLCIGNSL